MEASICLSCMGLRRLQRQEGSTVGGEHLVCVEAVVPSLRTQFPEAQTCRSPP